MIRHICVCYQIQIMQFQLRTHLIFLVVVYEHGIYVGVSNKVFTYKCQRIVDCMEFFMACICLSCGERVFDVKGAKFVLLLRHTVRNSYEMMIMCFISYVSSHGVKEIVVYTMMSKICDVCIILYRYLSCFDMFNSAESCFTIATNNMV